MYASDQIYKVFTQQLVWAGWQNNEFPTIQTLRNYIIDE